MATGSICDYCGKDCGNAGAATNHEDACDQNPDNQTAETEPARREARGRETRPARRQDDQPTTAGGALAEGVIVATDENATVGERVGAIQSLVGVVGDGVERYQRYRERKLEEKKQRAANVELEPIPDYPECEKCGRQLGPDDIGADDEEIVCPGCGKHYRVIEPEQTDAQVEA